MHYLFFHLLPHQEIITIFNIMFISIENKLHIPVKTFSKVWQSQT